MSVITSFVYATLDLVGGPATVPKTIRAVLTPQATPASCALGRAIVCADGASAKTTPSVWASTVKNVW